MNSHGQSWSAPTHIEPRVTMMRTGWQRIVASAVTAVAPLAVTLAIGTAIAQADC
ncbi:MAG TPA: hypothetical protein VED43_10495 [Mycobacterium sp.]|nr:hypothetical protein [Mycobacterium sp.]